jgi:beta-N-acetylhexosaminidase
MANKRSSPFIRQIFIRRSWRIGLALIAVWLLLTLSTTAPPIQASSHQEEAAALLAQMSVEERVGQLFLVTFEGDSAPPESAIAELIQIYKVGGVAIQASANNITQADNAPEQVAHLINELQQLAFQPPRPFVEDEDAPTPTPVPPGTPIPLLIAMSHEGDGYPYNQILNGLTPIPNQMAIGATWQPGYARLVGEIVGREMNALGVNMLLGPSLDVLENPTFFRQNGLGTRSFGGDPYWVGLMGQAYIEGVHQGGDGRVAAIVKHFPGYGSADRPLNEELSTARRSLEQLRQIELAPFFAVANNPGQPHGQADGFMTTHIRYQGFQGNLRATTGPVTFDAQVLTLLLRQEELTAWRQQGGLIVSDALGVRAARRYYDDPDQEFPHRRIARDALLAGNDLLFVAEFANQPGSAQSELANIKDTIAWFQEKYRTDQSFQQLVDASALRILQLKLRLYEGDFSLEKALRQPEETAALVGQNDGAMFELARDAITLISPSPGDLTELLPPGSSDQIVIFTDERTASQCAACPPQPWLNAQALETQIMALYGPEAIGQVQSGAIRSFTFAELQEFLDAGPGPIVLPTPTAAIAATATPEPDPEPGEELVATLEIPTPTPQSTPQPSPAFLVQTAVQNADWIIFAILDPHEQFAESGAFQTFLAERPDIVRSANIIVMAFNAPYFLDTTDISKLTAYFGVYSKTEPFVNAAVRALFQELPLRGAAPVDIEGVRYSLLSATQPDPRQVIELYIISEGRPQSPPGEAPLEATPGDTLRLQTGRIRDRNGHTVPDGTLVQFIQQDRIQGFVNVIGERPTINGVANLDYILEARTGQFRITAAAGDARVSQEIDIAIGETASVSIRPIPSATPTPTPTLLPTLTPTPTEPPPTATPTPEATPELPAEPVEPAFNIPIMGVWMLLGLMGGILLTTGAGWVLSGYGNGRRRSLTHRLRWLLFGVIGSLLMYNYLIFDLPGATWLAAWGGWGALLAAVVGGAAGLLSYKAVSEQ